MPWFSAFVLFAIVWAMVLFIVLPIRLKTQGESGDIVPGTPSSAPANPQMKRRLVITTAVSLVIWGAIVAVIVSGVISIEDLDVFYRPTP